MKKNVYIILLVIYSSATLGNHTPTLQKIKSFFSGKMLEKTEQKEIATEDINTLAITNIHGSITVKSGPTKSLCLKTIIRAKKQDDIDATTVAFHGIKNGTFSVSTEQKNSKNRALVEYELIVPATLNVDLTILGSGTVSVKDIHGTIDVIANDTVSIANTRKLVCAQTLKKGGITISNAYGPVETQSTHGTIIGENIAQSFYARSEKGKINIAYKKVPSTSSIDLKSISGNITLGLPHNTNAELRSYTEHGTLVSDLYILIKPFTTQLNSQAWKKFKQAIDGSIGSGEATIALHSCKGNIRITEVKTT